VTPDELPPTKTSMAKLPRLEPTRSPVRDINVENITEAVRHSSGGARQGRRSFLRSSRRICTTMFAK